MAAIVCVTTSGHFWGSFRVADSDHRYGRLTRRKGSAWTSAQRKRWGSFAVGTSFISTRCVYYYPAHRDLEVGVVEPRRYPKLLAQAVWLRLPLTATAWVGDRIYARLRLNDNIGAIDLRPDISVIICTQNRASSLQVTLEHLVAADRDGIRAEVIIVDNAGHDNDKKPKRRSRFNGIAKELCELYAQS